MFVRDSNVRYRPVPGFPGYEVGDDGSVWSYKTNNPLRSRSTPRLLRQATVRGQRGPRYFLKPYKLATMMSPDGRQRTIQVGRIVLSAFVGPCPPGMETRHLDNNPENNRLTNLCWGTKQENGQDKRNAGNAKGHRNGRAKLTDEQVGTIFELYAAGHKQAAIAEEMGVSQTLVSLILRRANWTHVVVDRVDRPRRVPAKLAAFSIDELAAIVERRGSINAAAKSLDVGCGTLMGWLRHNGVMLRQGMIGRRARPTG